MVKTSGIVLAAGLSSRAEGFKMTYPLGGSTVIEQCIDSMEAACQEIIVVGGYRAEALEYLRDRYQAIHLVINEDFQRGMFSSVRRGLAEASGGQAFITPGDCPMIPQNIYAEMLGIGGEIIVPSYCGEKGHPVLLRSGAICTLLAGNYGTLRDFIQSFGYVGVAVDEPGILTDMDTLEDYRAMLAIMEGSHDSYCDRACEQR